MSKFQTSNPIYLQIVENICYQIVRGDIQPGEKLLSVREMAVEFGVNPNTIQRTYSELERMGIVETRRGQGTFVCEDEKKISDLKDSLQTKVVEAFVSNMKKLGAAESEMKRSLSEYLNEKGGGRQ